MPESAQVAGGVVTVMKRPAIGELRMRGLKFRDRLVSLATACEGAPGKDAAAGSLDPRAHLPGGADRGQCQVERLGGSTPLEGDTCLCPQGLCQRDPEA